jgi:hypothetical protein
MKRSNEVQENSRDVREELKLLERTAHVSHVILSVHAEAFQTPARKPI